MIITFTLSRSNSDADPASMSRVVLSLAFCVMFMTAAAAAATDCHQCRRDASCAERTAVQMRPDDYLRHLLYFGQCVDGAADEPYDYEYLNAVRRNVAESCREFVGRLDVAPAARRLVYNTANLYLQRIGRMVYEHEVTMATGPPLGNGPGSPFTNPN